MVKSAFEWLLGVDEKVNSLVHALNKLAAPSRGVELKGPLRSEWQRQWPKANRPLEAWARDFCLSRNAAAHGGMRGKTKQVWDDRVHLAFAAMLFPLLYKRKLNDLGMFAMSEYDQERLGYIDQYLMNNPFAFDWNKSKLSDHPWIALDTKAKMKIWAEKLYKNAEKSVN